MSFEPNLGLSPRARKRRTTWRHVGMIKVAAGCIDCGYDAHAEALQFDHVEGDKKGNVSDLVRSDYSWLTIMNEINKCEVRCANCHAVMTAHRKLSYRESVPSESHSASLAYEDLHEEVHSHKSSAPSSHEQLPVQDAVPASLSAWFLRRFARNR